MNRKAAFVFVILLNCGRSFCQTGFLPEPIFKRTSDLLTLSAATYPLGISRFIQNLNINQYDDWTSSFSAAGINGIPFRTFPLNFTSPDFIPIDLLQIDSAEMYTVPVIEGFSLLPSGGIDLKTKELADSFSISFRAFTGSETGDPLIHHFTREQLPVANKNKIVPSGVVSAGGSNPFRYRFTAGYFGYFAFNSSDNGNVLSGLGKKLITRQNRQILGSAEAVYSISGTKKISLYSSLINFYGWEIPPFITSFVHLRSLSFANRLTFENLFNSVNAGLKYDGNVSRIRELDLVPSARFSLNDMSLFAGWNYGKGNDLTLNLYGEAGRFSGKDMDAGSNYRQNIFGQSRSYFYYYLTPEIGVNIMQELRIIITGRVEKNINPGHTWSGSMKLQYYAGKGNRVSLLMSSISLFPGIFEKYGSFITIREADYLETPDTFFVKGGSDLSPGRVNSVSGTYSIKKSGFQFSISPAFRYVESKILLKDHLTVQSIFPGDIVRKSEYINSEENFYNWNLNNTLRYRLKYLIVSLSHSGTYRSSSHSVNRFVMRSAIPAAEWGTLSIEYFYSTPFSYKNFAPANNTGFSESSGRITEISVLSLAYSYMIHKLYSLKEISLSLRIDNLFNKRLRFHPMGNNIDRAIEFYLSFRI